VVVLLVVVRVVLLVVDGAVAFLVSLCVILSRLTKFIQYVLDILKNTIHNIKLQYVFERTYRFASALVLYDLLNFLF
jgi:hypothetical protein